MGASKRTDRRLRFEPLEGRSLLSGLLIALQPHVARPDVAQVAEAVAARSRPTAATVSATAATATPPTATTGNGVFAGPSGPNAGVPLPVSPGLGQGTPTARELARETFAARFNGPMATLAPRFSDQSKILYLRGLGTAPRFFLHGDYTLAMVFPAGFNRANPGGTYNAQTGTGVKPVTGFAFLDDKNNNSGATVGLDLSADPTSFDSLGRPTRLFFTSDPNIYSGVFYVSQSSGVVTIRYGKTTATATFNGRLYTTGLTSPFQNSDLYAQHSG